MGLNVNSSTTIRSGAVLVFGMKKELVSVVSVVLLVIVTVPLRLSVAVVSWGVCLLPGSAGFTDCSVMLNTSRCEPVFIRHRRSWLVFLGLDTLFGSFGRGRRW